MESPVLLIRSITACVLGDGCLVLGVGCGFAGASLVVCVVVMVVGVVTFADWLRSGRARADSRGAVTRLSAAGLDVALVTSSVSP
ncbi:hypothetical protein HUN59_11640 [Curtobacterium sp. Csp2]|uniref:hypothetical protein n=1 Tax=Curtobacterium sp. Csp2 TaxID=2495430 RepID=UPI00157FD5F1|nr:hypothetical protein [Curtobacterium sp. Csp2]QKS14790.1 hypothetical protein HUN59_11640 [Curtobacterium sp. Csp2]